MSTIGTSRKSTHSRQASTTAIPKPHVDIDTRSDVIPDLEEHHPNDATKGPKPHYTLFIRLPFPRGDFQDPPPISWDASKDKQLWKCISSGTSKDLNWKVLSIQFDVPLSFLLQQAAWLYERHFEGMKKGMMRLGAGTGSGTPSPLPQGVDGSAIAEEGDVTSRGGVAMERAGSRDSEKPSTQLPKKPGSHLHTEEARSPASPPGQRPGMSRTPSTATVTQSRMFTTGSRRPSQTYSKGLLSTKRLDATDAHREEDEDHDVASDGSPEPNSEDETIDNQPIRRSPLSKRPALRTLTSENDAEDEEDDDDDSGGGFLPFASRGGEDDETGPSVVAVKQHPNTTASAKPSSSKPASRPQPQDDSASSTTSSNNQAQPKAKTTMSPDALSPQQRAQLAKLSPRYRNVVSGSEGSPSMGSSFSDLDDLSVTQSALEDALLSHVARGGSIGMGMGSLISRGRGNG